MTTRKILLSILLPVMAATLVACGGDGKTAAVPAPTNLLSAEYEDIYVTNCAVCHHRPGTGAPLSGVVADWEERVAPGMEVVLSNAMDGYGAMPPMGGCFDCSEEDFRVLIEYMAAGLLQ